MNSSSKLRTQQHVIDARAQDLFRDKLPSHWVVRDYRPDYGIDFSIEIFEDPNPDEKGSFATETLGEHLLIQLKGTEDASEHLLKVHGRHNVEKSPLTTDTSEEFEIPTFRKSIETSELVTVQRMGAALPVLLVIGNLAKNECYFVCLNDYIDKILVPFHDDYTSADSRTIHIPQQNIIGGQELGYVPLRWYAKRPKLYAAFQKFHYQLVELEYASDTDAFLPMAQHFASLLKNYDFWSNTEMWAILNVYFNALNSFINTGHPGLMQETEGLAEFAERTNRDVGQISEMLREQNIMQLWRGLCVLPRNYEELCREWFLPTPVGLMSSYPT